MLGRDLVPTLSARHQVSPLGRLKADITDEDQVVCAISAAEPDAVIHAAAFTAVDRCESEPDLAFQINSTGTGHVAAACRRLGIPMVYFSTDYVFDGTKPDPYLESDAPNPLSVYGKSKWEGEKRVIDALEHFWIIRVSWLFGPQGKNFVRTILGMADEGKALRVVDDQRGAPTYTEDLSLKIDEIIRNAPGGIYHVTNQGYCSWFDFAREALKQAGLERASISPIATSETGRPAPRPANSRLANSRLEAEGLGLLPSWQDALARYLRRDSEWRRRSSRDHDPT